MASKVPTMPSWQEPRLGLDQISDIAELSAAYLKPEAAEFSEEDLLSNLQALHQISGRKDSKIPKKDASRIQKMIMSLFGSRAHRGNRNTHQEVETGGSRFFPARHYHHDPNQLWGAGPGQTRQPRLEMLKRLLDKGGITNMVFNTKFSSKEDEERAVEANAYGSQLKSNIMIGTKKDFHEYLQTENSKEFARFHFNFGFRNLGQLYMKLLGEFGSQSDNYVLAMPALEKKIVEFPVTEKKLFRSVTRMETREEMADGGKVLISFNMLTGRKDTYGRGGLYWRLSIECTKDAAKEILSNAPKTHRELYDFFVEAVPGFSTIEGTDYNKFVEPLKHTNFKQKEFSSMAEMNKHYNIPGFS